MNPLLLFVGKRRLQNATLIQSKVGVSGSGVTSATDGATFTSPTTNGSLLICVVIADADGGNPVISIPLTAGVVWTLLDSIVMNIGGTFGRISVYYKSGAPVVSTATTSTVNAPGSSFTETQLSIYEFSGILSAGVVDTQAVASGTSSIPAAANLTTTMKDLIFVSEINSGAQPGPGAGFTAGLTMTNITFKGTSQFILGQAPGSIATAFGGSIARWACVAGAFKV